MINSSVLVLNRHFQAVHVTTVIRSLVMLWNDSARVIEPEEYRLYSWPEWAEVKASPGEPCIRTARGRLRAPGSSLAVPAWQE